MMTRQKKSKSGDGGIRNPPTVENIASTGKLIIGTDAYKSEKKKISSLGSAIQSPILMKKPPPPPRPSSNLNEQRGSSSERRDPELIELEDKL